MSELKVFYLPVGELKEYANNSKIHSDANVDAIRNSIERFGMCDPVAVWKNAEGVYEIVEGHGRKLALEQLGNDTVPCIDLSHLTDEERRVYSHVHNQTTLMSELDLEVAGLDFDGTEFDMEDFGFDALEVATAVDGTSWDDGMLSPEELDAYAGKADDEVLKSYNVIICCLDEDEQEAVKAIIREEDRLKRLYMASEIIGRFDA